MLRWALLLLMLSIIEGTFGHSKIATSAIATISFVLAIGLIVLFQRTRKTESPKAA